MEGTPFGRYQLIELLGRGGMGEVWRAHDTVTDRVVAIKVLPASLSRDEDFQRRFRREAHAAARLDTPHVVPIYDYGEIDGQLFVCMRLIEGRDLQALLIEGPLHPARAVRIVEQVAEALHAAHETGLIHRDVKPSNVLLDRNDFAYLIDFGIARVAAETRITKTGNTIGTFAYIAPERLNPQTEEDARADIYSLACVLYEALTGQPPFAGTTTAHLIAAHLNTPPPRPSTAQPDVPPQVDEVVATGMAKDPDERYATTIEFADAARGAITVPIAGSTSGPTPTRPTEQACPITARLAENPPSAGDLLVPADQEFAATQLAQADDGPRSAAAALPRSPSAFCWVPATVGGAIGVIATVSFMASASSSIRRLIKVPREFINDYLFNFPDTSFAWTVVLALLAAALTARKRIAWAVLLSSMFLSAVLNVADIVQGGNTAAQEFGETIGFVFHVVASVLLLVSYREFWAKPRKGAPLKASVVLITGEAIGALLAWVLVEMFPGTLESEYRFWYATNRAVGFALIDPDEFVGKPSVLLNAVIGLLGALALMAATTAWLRSQSAANALNDQEKSHIRALLTTYDQNDRLPRLAERQDTEAVFAEGGRAAIAFSLEIGVCLAKGDPIGDPHAWQQAIQAWLQLCRTYSWTPGVVEASAVGAQAYGDAGLIALQIAGYEIQYAGRSKLFGPRRWAMRQAVKRARRISRQRTATKG